MKLTAKKITSLMLALTLTFLGCFSLASCSDDGKYTIGICQLVQHEALDAATEGFMQAVKDELGEENVTFDVQNAANSNDTCVTIANNFVSKNVDLIMANATGALQAAANATETIPILGTSITEYGVALGIENFTGTVGNVTLSLRNNYALESVDAGTYNVTVVVTIFNEAPSLYVTNFEKTGSTGIESIEAAAGEAEYFNLQGVRVANPENGLYIRRQGGKAVKVLVK